MINCGRLDWIYWYWPRGGDALRLGRKPQTWR